MDFPFKWLIIHLSSEAAGGKKAESKLLHPLPGWFSFILHHIPAQPFQLTAYSPEVVMDQPFQNSWRGRTEERMEAGDTPLHLHQAEMPVCSSLQLLLRPQSRLSSKAGCAGSCRSVVLAPGTHPAFQRGLCWECWSTERKIPVPAQHRYSSPEGQ